MRLINARNTESYKAPRPLRRVGYIQNLMWYHLHHPLSHHNIFHTGSYTNMGNYYVN